MYELVSAMIDNHHQPLFLVESLAIWHQTFVSLQGDLPLRGMCIVHLEDAVEA